MTKQIKFTDSTGNLASDYYPRPAFKEIPEWFRNLAPFRKDLPVNQNSSAKRCVPLLDAMTAGYILPLPLDVVVYHEGGKLRYQWAHGPEIGFQTLWQVGDHKRVTDEYEAVPKFPNPWAVETPRGYSCLYVPPLNADDNVFDIFSAVVDTDTYNQQGTLPFLLRDPNWEGLIPAGTPMAQVIPFRRDSYRMVIGDDNHRHLGELQYHKLRSVFRDGYRKMFWSPKSYK